MEKNGMEFGGKVENGIVTLRCEKVNNQLAPNALTEQRMNWIWNFYTKSNGKCKLRSGSRHHFVTCV